MALPRPNLSHLPALDGLRGVAILLVLGCHCVGFRPLANGFIGVDLFFVLSGFLITRLLLEEHGRAGRIDLRAFYARRARRLLPAVVLMLVVVTAWQPALLAESVAALCYGTNVVQAFGGGSGGLLAHTWSLSPEEKFYAAWPLAAGLILSRFHDRRRAAALLAGAALLSAGWRAVLFARGAGASRLYFGPDTRLDGLAIGCALAFAVDAGLLVPGSRAAAACRTIGAAGLVGFLALPPAPAMRVFLAGGALVVSLCAAGVVLGGVAGKAGVLGWRPLKWLGTVSYGVYLWHYPLIESGLLPPVAAVLAAVAVAALSFYLVERRFQRPARVRWIAREASALPGVAQAA